MINYLAGISFFPEQGRTVHKNFLIRNSKVRKSKYKKTPGKDLQMLNIYIFYLLNKYFEFSYTSDQTFLVI